MIKAFLEVFKFKKGNSNWTKIILLGCGLAMGMILIAKIYYERVFDNFMEDPEQVYLISTSAKTGDSPTHSYPQTPGAIAPGIKAYSPAVEAATRTTGLASNVVCKVLDKNGNLSEQQYKTKGIITADTSFFEIFTRQIVGNNPKEGLNILNHIYISRSFAQTIAPQHPDGLIGSMLSPVYVGEGQVRFVIDGIFEDFPTNSSFKNTDLIVSMPTMGLFTWDGSNNWMGNDRYSSFVKLFPGYTENDLDKSIEEMCQKNLPQEELKKAGVSLTFQLTPLSTDNISNSNTAQTCLNLLILAVLVLVASVLNYVLIAISAMVHKSKAVAVHKCYGAGELNIYKMVFSETFVNILLSVILSGILIFGLRGKIEGLIGTNIGSLITPGSMLILGSIGILIFLLCGFLPGMAYAKIPVASAFRRYKETSRKWKLILLFLQFTASAFLIGLLTVVILQYNHMTRSSMGYAYEKLAIVRLSDEYKGKQESIRNEVTRLPFVEGAVLTSMLPIEGQSGNNISLPGDDRDYFNIADMYFVGPGYFNLMEIKIIEGQNFNETAQTSNEVMVSRTFVKKMEEMAGWKDGAIGKNILISEHSQSSNDVFTICGVYEDYVLGTHVNGEGDFRPTVQFFSQNDSYYPREWLVIKLKEMSPSNLAQLNQIVSNANPNVDNIVMPYRDKLLDGYRESKRFKDSVMISGIIVLIITLIGLLGYSQDEINRRRSEIAVRKINGATVPELMKLFLNNVFKLALPAVIIGSALAYFAAEGWLEMFTQKITLGWYIFAVAGVLVLLFVSAIVALKTYSAANANPIHNLKND